MKKKKAPHSLFTAWSINKIENKRIQVKWSLKGTSKIKTFNSLENKSSKYLILMSIYDHHKTFINYAVRFEYFTII